MKITSIEIGRIDIPYAHEFPTSFTVYRSVRNVIVKIHADNGLFGVGESAPLPGLYGETQDSSVGAIKFVTPALIGMEVNNIVGVHKIMDKLLPIGNFTAKCAIDVALHDLLAKSLGVPVYKLIGGKVRDTYETHIATRPGTLEEMVVEMKERIAAGYKTFKVKAGGDAAMDAKRIEYLLDNVDENVLLSVDVNQGWNPYETIKVINRVVRYKNYQGNVMIEQPIRSQDIENLALITQQSPIPIIADDAVCTKEQALEVVRRKAAHIINIKISKAGGIHKAKQLVGLCEAAGMPYIIDEITETRVCGTAVSHLAVSVDSLVYGGCTCHIHLTQDPVKSGGLSIDNGIVSIPDAPGLGLELNEEIIRWE